MIPIVVDTSWLEEHISDPEIAIVDVRPPHFYLQGHIPGAVNLPAFYLSAATGAPPSAEDLQARLGALSITRDTHIVAYDSGGSYDAARLYWVLRYYRHPAVSVLDAGITKWRHEGREWEYEPAQPAPVQYEIAAPDPTVLADLQTVRAALGSTDTVIVDTRSPAEYLGLQVTAARNGHIPGAVNIDWTNNFVRDPAALAELRPDDELRQLYGSASVTPEKLVIVHCQTSGRSSETFMVLNKLGYSNVALYFGGWQEWGNLPDAPVEEA